MATEMYGTYSHETHEQFVQRASRVFPEHGVRAWSRIERAVFNHLLGRLIIQHGYDAISDQMLEESRENMNKFIGQLAGVQAAQLAPDL
ncbi:MAG: hypothetical protein Q8N89_03200 [Azonexus sp.]|nr:hypothetical protein [Azonexus sp.]